MANNKHTQLETDAEQNEPVFVVRMIRIKEHDSVLIIERSLCFLEGNVMFPGICLVLSIIPYEPQLYHMYNVLMDGAIVKRFMFV